MNPVTTNLRAAYPVEPTVVAQGPPNRHGGRAGKPSQGRWQLVLESRWQRKIDEVVILSQARSEQSSEPVETQTAPQVRRSRRLGARIDAALDEVAAIEEALARLDDSTYGICAGCDRSMGAEWLTETPETRYCPDCSLRLVSWRPRSKRNAAGVQRSDAPAEAERAAPRDTRPERRQARRPAEACRL